MLCMYVSEFAKKQRQYIQNIRRNPWYSGSSLDCWPTGRAIDPSPGAWFITKFISFAQAVSGLV